MEKFKLLYFANFSDNVRFINEIGWKHDKFFSYCWEIYLAAFDSRLPVELFFYKRALFYLILLNWLWDQFQCSYKLFCELSIK
jgi:hypothetical protein